MARLNLTTEQTFVVSSREFDGVVYTGRWAFSQDILDECGIHSGQTVSQKMISTLLEMTMAELAAQAALKKAAKDSA